MAAAGVGFGGHVAAMNAKDCAMQTDAELTAAVFDLERRIALRTAGRALLDLAGDKTLDRLRAQRAKLEAEQRRRERGRLAADLRTRQAVLRSRLAVAYEVAAQMEHSAAELDALDKLIGAPPAAVAPVRHVRAALESLLAG